MRSMIPPFIEQIFMKTVDTFFKFFPQAVPTLEQLKNCKLISHRGERDNKIIFENTLASLGKAVEHSIWGIEFDIRWTQDLVPVVFHDKDCQRVFKNDLIIGQVDFKTLREKIPLIPSLSEVIKAFAKKAHLVIEIKKEPFPDLPKQQSILKDHLENLHEQEDFHIITLHPENLPLVDFLHPKTKALVADINVTKLAQIAQEKNLAGLMGHYFFLNNDLKDKLHKNKQLLGTGYVRSKNLLFRELGRDIDWIFSNEALYIDKMRKQTIQILEKSL